jgi:hypothetical protein
VRVLIIAIAIPCCRAELQFSTVALGGGLFEYDLTLSDPFDQPLSGLNILHANSVFGLDTTSTISAPAGWSFFPPLPPFIDELNYFTPFPSAFVPIGGSRAGFSFDSTTNPSTLGGQIAFDVIGGTTGDQIPPVPEPSTFSEVALGAVILVCSWLVGKKKSL